MSVSVDEFTACCSLTSQRYQQQTARPPWLRLLLFSGSLAISAWQQAEGTQSEGAHRRSDQECRCNSSRSSKIVLQQSLLEHLAQGLQMLPCNLYNRDLRKGRLQLSRMDT